MSKIEPYIGDPGDEHREPLPMRAAMDWYRDEDGYLWPLPAEGRVKVEDGES